MLNSGIRADRITIHGPGFNLETTLQNLVKSSLMIAGLIAWHGHAHFRCYIFGRLLPVVCQERNQYSVSLLPETWCCPKKLQMLGVPGL